MERFPKGFLWGSATSSYQVEGGIENNDWAEAAREGKVPVCGRATDHYNRYESDFDIAKSLGQNAHRLSIEWARIEPEEGRFDEREIEHYRKVLRSLRARNLEPFVTLWHFTLPLWFSKKGGFQNFDAPKLFARYCSYVVEKLGSEAQYWITINEPLVWASVGYRTGKWPPFKKNIFSFIFIINQLVKAHSLSYERMKKASLNVLVGIAKNNIHFDSNILPWNTLLYFLANWFWNERFLNKIKNYQDFIGLNYYFHKKFGVKEKLERTDMGWCVFPQGLYRLLVDLKKYGKPIYITESGIADANDSKRANFIRDHVVFVKKAIDEGADVRGYFYWSLLDNYEWASGFKERFGLVEVNYETLERKIRPSAFIYKKIAESSLL
ncbi:glycoside hydrolase family 1 protein [Patescibacteria group bacterium]|nr:MAG: glycoside hydrolase family 1 protein [Patescibacteria group bacterium]